MIVLGIILLLIGYFTGISILYTIGGILVVIGIVTTLTSDWGVRSSGTETTVWAVLPMEAVRIA